MLVRAVLPLLLTAPIALAQPGTRDRGHFSLHGDPATAMAVDPQVKHVLIAFQNGTVVVFPADQRTVALFSYPVHKKAVTAARFTPDSKSFVTTGADGALKVWDVQAARKHHKELEDSNGDGKPAVPKPTRTIDAHSGLTVTALAVRPDGKQFATGATDGTVKLWHADTGKLAAAIRAAHPGGVKAVEFSPDGRLLASAGADRTVKLWDPDATGPTPRHTLDGHEGPVNAVAFGPDGKQLAAGTGVARKAGTVHVWDVDGPKRAYKLEGHEDVVTCLVFHPKSAHLASGGADKKIRVWDLKAKEARYADGHAEPLVNLVITPDGVRFGSCSARAVRWWAGFGK